LYLPPELEEVAKAAQDGHRETNVREGLIQVFVRKLVPKNYSTMSLNARRIFWGGAIEDKGELVERDRVCALEVWCECLDGDPKMMRRSDAREINQILANLAGARRTENALRFGYCGVQRGFTLDRPDEKSN